VRVASRAGQPFLEAHGAEPGVVARRERAIVQLCAEIAGVDVGHDLARVLARGQVFPRELVEAESFRSGKFHHAVDGSCERDVGERSGDIVRRHRLKQGGRQSDDLSIGRGIDDPADELEELGGAQDRVGNLRGPDQVLLRQLGAEVTAFRKPVSADNGQRDMMPHVAGGFGSEQVTARRLEEFQNRTVLEGGRVGDIDDNFGTRQRLVEALARDRVDARTGSGWNRFVALLTQLACDLGSDEAGTADEKQLDHLRPAPSHVANHIDPAYNAMTKLA
jgi:hypothetical protein